jgi:hypothetical protein
MPGRQSLRVWSQLSRHKRGKSPKGKKEGREGGVAQESLKVFVKENADSRSLHRRQSDCSRHTQSPSAFFMHPLPSGVAMEPDNSVLWNCLESRQERRNPDHDDYGIVRMPTVPWYPHTVSTDWSTLWNSPNLDFCVHMEFPLVLSTVWNCRYPGLFSALQCWPDIGKWAGYQQV